MNAFSYNANNAQPHPKPFKVPMIFHLVTKDLRALDKTSKVLAEYHKSFSDFANLKISF